MSQDLMPGAVQIMSDPIAEMLDGLAALGTYWQRHRDAGRMPHSIRNAMIHLSRDVAAQMALLEAAARAQEPQP